MTNQPKAPTLLDEVNLKTDTALQTQLIHSDQLGRLYIPLSFQAESNFKTPNINKGLITLVKHEVEGEYIFIKYHSTVTKEEYDEIQGKKAIVSGENLEKYKEKKIRELRKISELKKTKKYENLNELQEKVKYESTCEYKGVRPITEDGNITLLIKHKKELDISPNDILETCLVDENTISIKKIASVIQAV